MNGEFLFRGVNSQLHQGGKGLHPKSTNAFSYGAQYGEANYGTGWTYGNTDANAVQKHQLNQAGFPTPGISTTPIYDRAAFYATAGGQHQTGYVYKINRQALRRHGVQEFVVNEFTTTSSVPEDQEVILVVSSGGGLPDAVVTETIKIASSTA
jgi:alanyl-tRNA synthetase